VVASVDRRGTKLAASGPLYIDRIIDPLHIIVFTREGELLLLRLDGNRQQTARVPVRSLGWNPREKIRYCFLILLCGLALSPLVVWAWRRFYTATDLISVQYSH
jgi:hypothetical protein